MEVHTSLQAAKNEQFLLQHVVLKNGKVMAKGETQMVCVDAEGKLKRMPQDFKGRLMASPLLLT